MAKNKASKATQKAPKTKNGGKSVFRKIMKVIFITILCIFGLNLLTTILYRWINPPITLTMISRSVFEGESLKKEWKSLDEISPYLVDASVASEDNMFLGHNGFDRVAIDIAIEEHKSGKSNRGGSGISQQTAKNVFLWQGRSWIRKGLEVYQTFLIELFWSKERSRRSPDEKQKDDPSTKVPKTLPKPKPRKLLQPTPIPVTRSAVPRKPLPVQQKSETS